jgi:GT2 family glycosyltransferase
MSLIGMCVHCTDDNNRLKYFKMCIESLLRTVDLNRHRIVLINNGSNVETSDLLNSLDNITLITPDKNLGTAKGINLALSIRNKGEKFIKCDDDVVWSRSGWVEEMEECIDRDNDIGIIGLKRKDLAESPNSIHPFYKSELEMLPHEHGQKWYVVEKVKHVIGTCQMLSDDLIKNIGYYFQNEKYGLDDSDISYRSELSGFKNVFLLNTHIDHIDPGGGIYEQWKHEQAGIGMSKYGYLCESYRNGTRNLYYDGGFE